MVVKWERTFSVRVGEERAGNEGTRRSRDSAVGLRTSEDEEKLQTRRNSDVLFDATQGCFMMNGYVSRGKELKIAA